MRIIGDAVGEASGKRMGNTPPRIRGCLLSDIEFDKFQIHAEALSFGSQGTTYSAGLEKGGIW